MATTSVFSGPWENKILDYQGSQTNAQEPPSWSFVPFVVVELAGVYKMSE
jgi:hypothetical protein